MNSLKKIFSLAAMGIGGAGIVWGGLGLATRSWSSADQGGVDLTAIGIGLTVVSAAIFYGGYKGLMAAAKMSFKDLNQSQKNQPPDLKP